MFNEHSLIGAVKSFGLWEDMMDRKSFSQLLITIFIFKNKDKKQLVLYLSHPPLSAASRHSA
jgi:hypothetical protein